MRAVLIKEFGGPEQLAIGSWPTPEIGPQEVLVRVHATALNRADTLQRMGKYPPPKGASPILGLEMAGEVVKTGEKVSQYRKGDRVCGLLGGGGYAEYVAIHESMAMPVPDGLDYLSAAAIPEVFLTAFQAISWIGKLQKNENILIHAGASGVGTAAIQLARLIGAEVMITASAGKHALCKELGAHIAIDYQSEDFVKAVDLHTNGNGADLVIDFIGAGYFQQNLELLGMDGRMVMLAFLGGITVAELNLSHILRKRLQVTGSTLRARSLEYKAALAKDLKAFTWKHFEIGELKPIIDSVYTWEKVAEAHRYMESNQNKGKIVLEVL